MTIPLLSKISSLQGSSEAAQPGLSDLVRNPEDRISRDAAHIKGGYCIW